MFHQAPSSSVFYPTATISCKRVTCFSFRLRVWAALEKKKGFGEPAKGRSSSKEKKDTAPSKQEEHSREVSDEKNRGYEVKQDSRELKSVLRSIEKKHPKKHSRLNIDRDVAALGKVDFVKVESWGDEEQNKSNLGSLKVKSFSPAFSSTNGSSAFYERLVQRLQLLESKGEISVVHAKALPPFQDWAFGEERYLQYLVDQHAVFDALRVGVASIGSVQNEDEHLIKDQSLEKAALAVKIFDDTLGLERSKALWDDIQSLAKTMGVVQNRIIIPPQQTTQATSYVKYLKQLAGTVGIVKQPKNGLLRFLAHIFALYVTHLTTGMRIGAKALDCLSILKETKAVRFYRDYPPVFIAAINRIVDFVSEDEDQEVVMEELPKAIQKTSLLLTPLAVIEKRKGNNPANV
ncbi:hypothetical protein KP509_33G063700 [Ceratopteris richardii]|uniref:heme oxygenase (biliverdin-producing) n=1 Tax=Ceratopteris richardii TaxID=49495 RepID=A0A8T2QS78_CERRI|nr:hypothetical protein KP509_33G063700 [Ceratopteris richardii]